jgi:MFS transporter, DHA1 family, multidrug resistance protein
MFLSSFAWSFVLVTLPFYVQRLSTVDAAATLRWTGWILGVSSLITVVTAPAWGRYGGRGNPKALFTMVQFAQGAAFFGSAVARTLTELFLWRVALGFAGAGSTFAFITVGRTADAASVRREIANIQSGMTLGQVFGPLVGAMAAARFGFRASFVVGGLILFACGAVAHWGVADPEPGSAASVAGHRVRLAEIVAVSLIVLGGSMQLFFLTAILPQVVPALGVPHDHTLMISGVLVFVSGVAAAIGAVLASRLGDLFPERRVMKILLILSAVFVALLGTVSSPWLYGTLRFLEVLAIAPVFPIVVARIALRASGTVIGFVNAARIGASAVGPVLATSMLAGTSAGALYVLVALLTLACVPLIDIRPPRSTQT